ncbi:hypothetical protein CAPTEDRAFT_198764 [Capitella teleta]|uniref:Uncharacterized protein n=1 Tax=Capitella teleta TaxID=283909 RepID=R7VLL3_CAPTE|nr:hypothetical protein CAPTEDRAFT_198764 [Capitella teleta]|eukprot:ELU17685.1 hypothetical protein CAPTEDRAFT_198764 [Capitella teleta]
MGSLKRTYLIKRAALLCSLAIGQTDRQVERRNILLCYCGNEVPLQGAVRYNLCNAECKNGGSGCGFPGYARIVTSKGMAQIITNICLNLNVYKVSAYIPWTQDYKTNTNRLCAALLFEREWKWEWRFWKYYYYASFSQSDCAREKIALCITKYGDFFGNLPWADGYPTVNDRTCIQAVMRSHGIELIPSSCDGNFAFICISSDSIAETTAKATTQSGLTTDTLMSISDRAAMKSSSKKSTGVIVGAAIGGILAVNIIIAVVLVVLFSRRKRARSEATAPSVAYVNTPGAMRVESNVYSFEETSEDKKGKHHEKMWTIP